MIRKLLEFLGIKRKREIGWKWYGGYAKMTVYDDLQKLPITSAALSAAVRDQYLKHFFPETYEAKRKLEAEEFMRGTAYGL